MSITAEREKFGQSMEEKTRIGLMEGHATGGGPSWQAECRAHVWWAVTDHWTACVTNRVCQISGSFLMEMALANVCDPQHGAVCVCFPLSLACFSSSALSLGWAHIRGAACVGLQVRSGFALGLQVGVLLHADSPMQNRGRMELTHLTQLLHGGF